MMNGLKLSTKQKRTMLGILGLTSIGRIYLLQVEDRGIIPHPEHFHFVGIYLPNFPQNFLKLIWLKKKSCWLFPMMFHGLINSLISQVG